MLTSRLDKPRPFVPYGRVLFGSLFSGIGGLELGLERAGLGSVAWQVELDPFCRMVLAKYWPNAQRFDDVRAVGPAVLRPVDLVCGGFPCQDLSFAGKGAGLKGARSGLWWEYARIIRDMGPRFVVVENVPGLRSRGLDAVLGTLTALGYDAEWHSVRASDVGAPHRRERVFVIAWAVANPNGQRCELERLGGVLNSEREERRNDPHGRDGATGGWQTEPRMGRGPDGLPARVDRWPAGPTEAPHGWEPPRTVTEAGNRRARLRALGNAVVPQVAEFIGRRVLAIARELDAVATRSSLSKLSDVVPKKVVATRGR